MNTWAIFWYATIFKREGLCLNPSQSFVKNIGHDRSGIHCGENDIFISSLSNKQNVIFSKNIEENQLAIEYLKKFYKLKKKPL